MDEASKTLTKEGIQALIDMGTIGPAICLEDGSIELSYSVLTKGSPAIRMKDKYCPGSETYKILSRFTGPLKPGDFYAFEKNYTSDHEEFSDEMILAGIKNGGYKKAKMSENGSMQLFTWNVFGNQMDCLTFPADSSQSRVIKKETGPLKPGEEYYFENYKEPDQV